jgi:hypothetical protein
MAAVADMPSVRALVKGTSGTSEPVTAENVDIGRG